MILADSINLAAKFNQIDSYWTPKIIGELNDQYLKIAKVKGEFVWHNHQQEDELFQVIKGELHIHFESKIVTLNEGEIFIVPKGVNHKPVAIEECWILLIEPKSTKHTGEVKSELTQDQLDWI